MEDHATFGTPTVLVVGASGVIGGAHLRRLAGGPDWRAVALCRRPPDSTAATVAAVPLDLSAPPAEPPAALRPVTHLLFAAYADGPDRETVRTANTALLRAALDLAERGCPALRHVTLIQGMKAYGSHLGPFKTPAKESDPRIPGGHYYDDQLDALTARAAASGWAWTALRPHVVIGPARRSPQNLIVVLGVLASLARARREPLTFPGPAAAFDALYQATDADLLSRAIAWAGTDPRAAGQVFNITNGDFFRWRHVWPAIASVFDLEPGGPEPGRLAEAMAGADALWDRLVAAHGLQPNRLADLVSWPFAEYVFGTTWDVMADTLKCRRAGFLEFVDSETMLADRLRELRTLKIVP